MFKSGYCGYVEVAYEFKAVDKGNFAVEGDNKFYANIEPLAEAEIDNSQQTTFADYVNNDEPDLLTKGNAFYLINATARFGSVQVSADMKLSFPVEKGGGVAKIYGVTFEYISYEVSTVQKESEVGS